MAPPRQGRIKNEQRQPRSLMIKCNDMTLVIHGCGERTAGMLENYGCAGVPVPLEIGPIQEISWVELEKESFNVLDVIFRNDFNLTKDSEGVSLTQDKKETKE